MGFTATSRSGVVLNTVTSAAESATNRHIWVLGDVSMPPENDIQARFLAGDVSFNVNTRKMRRSLTITCLVTGFTTINTLNKELRDGNLWTFSITDHSATAMEFDGGAIKGTLSTVDYKLQGLEYNVQW